MCGRPSPRIDAPARDFLVLDHKITREELTGRLYESYFITRRNKRMNNSQIVFELDLEENMYSLTEDLLYRRYQFSPAICFIVEGKVKREVFAPQFRDRVVSQLLFSFLNPMFEPCFIEDSYSCRVGKGTSYGIRRLDHHLRSVTANYRYPGHVLKMDILGYFMSIDRLILEEIILAGIDRYAAKTDPVTGHPYGESMDIDFVKWLACLFIHRDVKDRCIRLDTPEQREGLPSSKSILAQPEGKGLIIGDLCSQLFSNILGNVLDQYAKRHLACRHYGRYVDDSFVVDRDWGFLNSVMWEMTGFAWDRLHLRMHPDKTVIIPTSEPIPFLGAVIRNGKIFVGQHTVESFDAAARNAANALSLNPPAEVREFICQSLNSYLGYLSGFRTTERLRRETIERYSLHRLLPFSGDYSRLCQSHSRFYYQ